VQSITECEFLSTDPWNTCTYQAGDAQGHAVGEGLVDDAFGGGGVGERDEKADRLGVVDNTIRTIVLKKRKDEDKEHYKDGKITMETRV
jgi:hypothetical protein